jgi:uncharacterized membrane protein YeaQ/YmgE (transglycosylase-associated protein family)
MSKTSLGFKKTMRSVLGWTLLFLAVLLGIVGAVLSFFLCALFLTNITLLSIIAVLICFLVSFSL